MLSSLARHSYSVVCTYHDITRGTHKLEHEGIPLPKFKMQQSGTGVLTLQSNTIQSLSIVEGPSHPPLTKLTFGQFIDKQAEDYGPKDAIVVPWTGARLSYASLRDRTQAVARGLLALGVRRKDHVAILCGDDERFIELFFACGRIGAVLVILNKTYTPLECEKAIQYTGN